MREVSLVCHVARVLSSHGTFAGLPNRRFSTVSHQCRHHPVQFFNAPKQPHIPIGKLLLRLPQTKQIDRSCR